MKLTITQEDNDKSIGLLSQTEFDILGYCPTALAYSRQTGRKLGTFTVGYGTIRDEESKDPGYNRLAQFFDTPLEKAVREFTTSFKPILGEFEIKDCR